MFQEKAFECQSEKQPLVVFSLIMKLGFNVCLSWDPLGKFTSDQRWRDCCLCRSKIYKQLRRLLSLWSRKWLEKHRIKPRVPLKTRHWCFPIPSHFQSDPYSLPPSLISLIVLMSFIRRLWSRRVTKSVPPRNPRSHHRPETQVPFLFLYL